MWKIRSAKIKEFEDLTNLAAESEAHWGFDEEFMDLYRIIYCVTPEILSENTAYVLEEEGQLIGFYIVIQEGYLGEVEYFYIKPKYIGKGFGRILWNHMIEVCDFLGILELELITSPEAVDFYVKMGAVIVKHVPSQVDSRSIPMVRYKIKRQKKFK